MKLDARVVLSQFLLLLLCMSMALAQPAPPRQAGHVFSQQELDQMLAPIALYPDALLSQILMASTYPLEIVEAARWSAANPGLNGDQAVQAVEQNNWDPSVKSLVAFPDILKKMEENLEWTERLGEAFLAQQPQLMDTVQNLRQRAMAQGNLRSTDQIFVQPQGQTILIEQVNPELVYVPYYDPNVVYGPWWWAAYPPIYWHPWPGYYARPGFAPGFSWGVGIAVGSGFFFGAFDWQQHHVNAVPVDHDYWKRHRPPQPTGGVPRVWQHDPSHRRGIPYRETRSRQQYGGANTPAETRRDYRGHDSAISMPGAATQIRPAVIQPEKRGGTNARPEIQNLPTLPRVPGARDERGTHSRSNVPDVRKPPDVERRPHVFEGIGQGTVIRDSSRRGRESLREVAPGQERVRPERSSGEPHGKTRDGKPHQ